MMKTLISLFFIFFVSFINGQIEQSVINDHMKMMRIPTYSSEIIIEKYNHLDANPLKVTITNEHQQTFNLNGHLNVLTNLFPGKYQIYLQSANQKSKIEVILSEAEQLHMVVTPQLKISSKKNKNPNAFPISSPQNEVMPSYNIVPVKEFSSWFVGYKKNNFSKDKIDYLVSYYPEKDFTKNQMISILKEISFSSDQLKAAEVMIKNQPHSDFSGVEVLFSFSSDKEKFRKMVLYYKNN